MIISARLELRNKLTPILEHTPTIIVNKGKLDTNWELSALKK